MGNGCSCKPSSAHKKKEVLLILHPHFSSRPNAGKNSVYQSLQKQKNLFRISITNMNVKNIQEEVPQNRTYYISVKFLNLDKQYVTENLSGRDLKIDLVLEQDMELTEQQMIDCEVLIQVLHYRQNYQVIGVKQNLLATAKGPYHHDLIINWPNQTQGRICYDFRIQHFTKMDLQVKQASCFLNNGLNQQNYKFCIKFKTEKKIFQSSFSNNYHNQFWDLSKEQNYNDNFTNQQRLSSQQNKDQFLKEQNNYNNNSIEDFDNDQINEFIVNRQLYKANGQNKIGIQTSQIKKIPFMKTNKNEIQNHDQNQLKVNPLIKQRTIHKVSSFVIDNGKQEKASPLKKKRRSSEIIFQNDLNFDFICKQQIKKKQSQYFSNDIHNFDDFIKEEKCDSSLSQQQESSEYQIQSIQNPNTILWDFENEINKKVQLSFSITTHSVGNSCIKFCLWVQTQNQQIKEEDLKYSSEDFDQDSQDGQQKTPKSQVTFFEEQIAECYIPFSKVLAEEAMIVSREDLIYEQRILHVREKLWSQGQDFGFVDLQIQSQTLPYLKQILVGVMTEKGIQKSSPSVYFRDDNIDSEINQLNEAKNLLIENTFRLQQNNAEIVGFERLKLKEELLNHFNKVFQISQMTHKQSTTSFYYKSQNDLIRAQTILIELADHLLSYADEVDEYLRESYYKCLKMILNRGEFNLDNIGFKQSYQQFVKGKAKNFQFKTNQKQEIQDLKKKLKVGLQYQNLMYQTLEKVLLKTESKYLNGEEKGFVENYCAIAFFRIPLFQQNFLSCLKFNDLSIPEDLKNIFQYFDQRASIIEGNKVFESLFDWQYFFESYMLSDQQGEKNYEHLQQIINENQKYWQRISKKGSSFFFFLSEWALYVNNTVISKDHIPWNELPGYQILMKSFLLQMAKKETRNLIDSLKIASMNLLLNPNLLKIYIHIAYRNTKVFDHRNVMSTFNLIDLWMQTLSQNHQNIPADFDLKSFLKGIQMILEGDHAMCISKGLAIIYNNYNLLSNDIRQEVIEYLFGNIFFKLFMHWSQNVRYVFHHLLVYRIEHLTKKFQLPKQDLKIQYRHSQDRLNLSQHKANELNKKYLKMMRVLENANYNYQNITNQQTSNNQKISQAKRLKQKLLDRKKFQEVKKVGHFSKQNTNQQDEDSKLNNKQFNFPVYHTHSIEQLDFDNQMLQSINTPKALHHQKTDETENNLVTLTEGLLREDTQLTSKSILGNQSKNQNHSPTVNGFKSEIVDTQEHSILQQQTNNKNQKRDARRENKSVQFNQKQNSSLTIIEQSFYISEMDIQTETNQVNDKSFVSKSSKLSKQEENKMEDNDNYQDQNHKYAQKNFQIQKIKRSITEHIEHNDQYEEQENQSNDHFSLQNTRSNKKQIARDGLKRISFVSPHKKQKALISGNKFLYIETLDKGNSLKKIEKQYIRYLPQAFEEFMQIKQEYQEWYKPHEQIINSMLSYDKMAKYLKDIEVPQVIWKQSIDRLEGYGYFYSDE
ncbi:hypothetical protein TTHERM_00145660 (macronuclear) [Tetrahymena thermophila SB210]|uniref:Uncharacterized protein n=1 Tax=Tetrahymena thermophila (strain SB210) TaxID=312017 RepID=I7MDU3_TETTS|nr:hypothetical protein TTHERM_00145660 [Tetrahymena thermophila SB210]EAR90961.2 hypothetical protein TTHERM_00145660 [Tetrahymena thermophila SB210]|eukprot:XP_001011206.2 hypothetical protein TTHERM_00145660 [Tetrahymena thermophila SB210]